MANTYFYLPPEMGGTRFGPFAGGITQIGSDPNQSQIVLNQGMGIAPVHVTIADQGNGQYTVSPVQRGFGLFLIQAGTNQAHPLSGAVYAKHGDSIVIGTPAGPRFTIYRDDAKPAAGAAGAAGGPGRGGGFSGMGGAVGNEMMRQAKARLMMRNPLFRAFYMWSYRARTGALTNPRVIVSALLGAGGLIAGAIALCGGMLAKIGGLF